MYPKDVKLKHKYRIAILLFFVAAFFILAPVIIFYTVGYRYDWKNHEIKKTGVISVDVIPNSSKVYVDGVKINQGLPFRLSNRAPGTYHLRIAKEGYKDWEKDVKVKSKKTTYIKNVELIKDNLPIKILGREIKYDSIDNIKFSPQGRYAVFFVQNDDIYEIKLLNLRSKQIKTLTRITPKNDPRFKWSRNNPFGYLILNNNTLRLLNTTINDQLGDPISFKSRIKQTHIKWAHNSAAPKVFTKNKDKIFSVTQDAKQLQTTLATNTYKWGVTTAGEIFVFSPKNNFLHIKEEGVRYRIKEELKKIIEVNQNLILAKTKENQIVIFKITSDKISSKAKINGDKVKKLTSPERWVAWSPWQFWSISRSGDINLITRTGEYIEKIHQLNNYNSILLKTRKGLKSFDTHYHVEQNIFSNGEIEQISVDKNADTIYMWGKIGNQKGLFKLEY
ncbi:MAG: PEGA domain-containing protein [Candidatus Paceibacteria bacterium]